MPDLDTAVTRQPKVGGRSYWWNYVNQNHPEWDKETKEAFVFAKMKSDRLTRQHEKDVARGRPGGFKEGLAQWAQRSTPERRL